MHYRQIRRLFVVLAVLSVAAFATASYADNDEAQEPAANGSTHDADESGATTLQPPAYSHVNPRGLAAPQAEPAGMPTTSKSGDDLIVHTSGGDMTYPGYLKGLTAGQAASVSVVVPGHGGCVLQVDSNGTLMSSKCDQ
jgi:hypothetical protein